MDLIRDVLDLQKDIIKKTNYMRYSNEEVIRRLNTYPNYLIGYYEKELLICYGALELDRTELWYKEYGHLKVTAVREDYRGLGLQKKLINDLEKIARENGEKGLWTTVHPDNKFSHRNIEESGFKLAKTVNIYDSVRDIMVKIF